MPYEHIICEVPGLGEVLDDVNESGGKIIGTMYFPDSQQACLIIERKDIPIDSMVKRLFEKYEEEDKD